MSNLSFLRRNGIFALCVSLGFLAGCSLNEDILSGEREEVRPAQALVEDLENIPPAQLPEPVLNTSWTHRNDGAKMRIANYALNPSLALSWRVQIGAGNSKRQRITADPIIADNRIFVLDAVGVVSALNENGALLWRRGIRPSRDALDKISGGGLAYSEGVLVATTGYGEVIAMDAATGETLWRQKFLSSFAAAPAVAQNTVVAMSSANEAMGLELRTGRIKWRVISAGSSTAVSGSGIPVIKDRLAILPFASGELSAVTLDSGFSVWDTAVTGVRFGIVRNFVGAISSDPVISGNTIFAGSQSGSFVSQNLRSGERNWVIEEGSISPVWVTRESVFVVTDQAKLKRLRRKTGEVLWAQNLPLRKERNPKRFKDVIPHFGPIIANNQILVASGDGLIRAFDPDTGALLRTIPLPGGAASHLAISDNRLYVLNNLGQLLAYR